VYLLFIIYIAIYVEKKEIHMEAKPAREIAREIAASVY